MVAATSSPIPTPKKKKKKNTRKGSASASAPSVTAARLSAAREQLRVGDRATALRMTVEGLERSEGEQRAAALHQAAVLVDDHMLPTHDPMAWRASVAAFRAAPQEPLYRREAVSRTVFRTPYAQMPRSVGNLCLSVGLLLLSGGRRFKPALLLLVPLALPFLAPGVVIHLLTNLALKPIVVLLEGWLSRRLLRQPEDETLVDDLLATVRAAAQGASEEPEVGEPGEG